MEELVVQMPSGKSITIPQDDAYEIVSCMGGGCKPKNMDSLPKDIIGAYEFSRCPGVPSERNAFSNNSVSNSELEECLFSDIEDYGLEAVLTELKEAACDMMFCMNALGSNRREVVDWGKAFRKQQEAKKLK